MGGQVGGRTVDGIEAKADCLELLEDRAQQLLGGRGGGVEDLHGHLFDAQHIPGEAGHFVGMEKQGFFLVAAVLGVELAGVEGGVEVAGVGVGVAIHRSPGTVERLLHLIDGDQRLALGPSRPLGYRSQAQAGRAISHPRGGAGVALGA